MFVLPFGGKAMYFIVTAGGVNISNADSAAHWGPRAVCGAPSVHSHRQGKYRACVGTAWHLSTDCRWNPLRLKYLS